MRRLVPEMRALLGEGCVNVVAPHHPVLKLRKLPGPVSIRAWWNADDGAWEAIEGSHRLLAAQQQGLPVEIVPVKLGDVHPNRNLDGTDILGWDPGVQAISVADALQVFRDFGKRPTYKLDVTVRQP